MAPPRDFPRPIATPNRRRRRSSSTEESITVDTTPIRDVPEAPRSSIRKKQRVNYNTLHNHGFQGPAPASPTTNSMAKKSGIQVQKASQASQQSIFTVPNSEEGGEEEEMDESQEPEKPKAGKRAWWWQFYTTTTLTTTFEKGRGKTKTRTPDERYDCKLCKNGRSFSRLASKLSGAASALKDHIEGKHKMYEVMEGNTLKSGLPTGLEKYLKTVENTPPFEEALVNWIVETCQPFTVTETKSYKIMMKAAGYTNNIIKAEAITRRIYDRAAIADKDLIGLLDRTCSTVALSFDGWTSLNNLSMLAINGSWAGPDIVVYKACFDFIEIKGTHSGENLAYYVYKRYKKLGILHKILTLTGDNASNNDTAARSLYKKLSYVYDDHLEENPIRGKSMRFQGEASKLII
jgi:hypothetical protein